MRYPYEHHTRSASGAAEKGEVTAMVESERDQIATESKDGVNVGMSSEESVKERPKAYPVMYTAATRGVLEYYYCRIQNSNYCTKLQVHHCFPNSICSWW